MRISVDKHVEMAKDLLRRMQGQIDPNLIEDILNASQKTESEIALQRHRVDHLNALLDTLQHPDAEHLRSISEYFVRRSVWLVGGDGWAYDIGSSGLDHAMASGKDINVLVMDTEVYSNTGGQASKSTPMGAVAKFAAAGKPTGKKDMALQATAYGNVYVARVAMGADPQQTLKAFREAEAYNGPSLILAYSHCIAHGYDLSHGCDQQKLAVDSGHWPLFRFDPRRLDKGEAPLQMDSGAPKVPMLQYVRNETRYRMIEQQNPEHFQKLMAQAQLDTTNRFSVYEQLAKLSVTAKHS
jgi:pyruvate-ferredoxin/flavodoxin oxidoreductase